MSDLIRRVGKFNISEELLREDPKVVQKVLSKVIVVRCENHFISRSLEYIAISDRFDVAEEGCMPPLYMPIIKNGFVSFEKMR